MYCTVLYYKCTICIEISSGTIFWSIFVTLCSYKGSMYNWQPMLYNRIHWNVCLFLLLVYLLFSIILKMDIEYLYYHTVLTISPPFNLFFFVELSKKKKKKIQKTEKIRSYVNRGNLKHFRNVLKVFSKNSIEPQIPENCVFEEAFSQWKKAVQARSICWQ